MIEKPPRSIESIISTMLRTGVTVSLILIVIGTTVSFVHDSAGWTSTRGIEVLLARQLSNQTFAGIARGLIDLRGSAMVTLGLLVLFATPVLRVAFSLLVFARERDVVYTVLTATVLVLLVASLLLGRTV